MKYYVVADVHGFYTELITALTENGFFADVEPHKLVVAGDLFDRGEEAVALQQFILELMDKDELIFVRGNHEDLFMELVNKDNGARLSHHVHNGTFGTALQLTGFDKGRAYTERRAFVECLRRTPYYRKIIPAAINFFEVGNYVVVHGWIPMDSDYESGNFIYHYKNDWRTASDEAWYDSRWINGIAASTVVREEGKTIICGHWHCSYGHSKLANECTEFGEGAIFTPYYGQGIIAIDACTVCSKIVNCIVIED